MLAENYDAVIIGAGIIGCCTALELARRGWRTLNLDRLPAAGQGSTSFSCAIIRTHYSTWTGTAMAYESSFRWQNWSAYLGAAVAPLAELRRTGCIVLKTAANGNLESMLAHTRALDIPHQELDREAILDRLPFLDLRCFGPPRHPDDPAFGTSDGREIQGGVYFPQVGYVNDPQLAARNAMAAATAHGARFRFNANVVAVPGEGGRVTGVTLSDGETISAPVVVNVGGPQSSTINRMAGLPESGQLATRALRQEVAYLPSVPGFDFEHAGVLLSDSDVGCYCRPEVGNRMVVGSENPACDPLAWVDPEEDPGSISEQAFNQVLRLAQRMPSLGIPGQLPGAAALYDVTPDWIPIYDRSDLAGFYQAIGTSGNQFKNAPIAGAIMAELIERCESGHDHDREPVQFRLRELDRVIDLGFFSRRRSHNADSSFSVLG